jgi:peptidase inhibitor I78 family protein
VNGQIAIMAGIFLAVSACATNPPADAAPPVHGATGGGTCDPANIQQFVGQAVTADVQAAMKQVSGASIVRIVPPGTMITMEYSPERLTVYTDANNRVEKIACS